MLSLSLSSQAYYLSYQQSIVNHSTNYSSPRLQKLYWLILFFGQFSIFYSDICRLCRLSMMAIAIGKILGFELTENFQRPYLAVSVTDFWHRWHISLSSWLKDYVYIPMGGSRCSRLCNYKNIFVTFLISGIWHGANWTFIIWGCLHGIYQIIEKALGEQKCKYGHLGKFFKISITFYSSILHGLFSECQQWLMRTE